LIGPFGILAAFEHGSPTFIRLRNAIIGSTLAAHLAGTNVQMLTLGHDCHGYGRNERAPRRGRK